jgi:hypothetical protein
MTPSIVAVATAYAGFGVKLTTTDTNIARWGMLSPGNNAASYNLNLQPGTYLISFWASANVAGHQIQVGTFDGALNQLGATLTLSTTRTRYTSVVTIPAETRGSVIIYASRSGVTGRETTVDSVLVERRTGPSNTPSAFTAGPASRQDKIRLDQYVVPADPNDWAQVVKASLPTPAAGNTGWRRFVTDATGATAIIPAYCTGTQWRKFSDDTVVT